MDINNVQQSYMKLVPLCKFFIWFEMYRKRTRERDRERYQSNDGLCGFEFIAASINRMNTS